MNDETKKDFLEEAEKEKKTLEESYQESKRQTEERRSNDYSKLLDFSNSKIKSIITYGEAGETIKTHLYKKYTVNFFRLFVSGPFP